MLMIFSTIIWIGERLKHVDYYVGKGLKLEGETENRGILKRNDGLWRHLCGEADQREREKRWFVLKLWYSWPGS